MKKAVAHGAHRPCESPWETVQQQREWETGPVGTQHTRGAGGKLDTT